MAPGAFAQELMLINPLDADRPQEVIEVPTVSCIALAPARMPLP
jgi:hypothetical protein